jgi:hypothetical protein
MKINSDDESIPYKKDLTEDSPEPTDPVRVIDGGEQSAYPYRQPYEPVSQDDDIGIPLPPPPPQQARGRWDGETEIN